MLKLKDLGEKRMLELARDICAKDHPIEIGIGDDGAVIDLDGSKLVVTTDMLIESIHFTKDVLPEQIGRKAAIVNLSDLAAMGVSPIGMVYSLGAPGETEADFTLKLLKSVSSTVESYGAYLIGGDMNEANQLILSGTAIGTAKEDKILLRSGAKPGDLIGVTGELGAASAGTEAFLKGIPMDNWKDLKDALFRPTARVEEGKIFSESGKVSSTIDLTDGLATDLWQICRMSKVGAVIDREKIPANNTALKFSKEHNIDIEKILLYGGEDFELLFTVEPDSWKKLEMEINKKGSRITKIGEITSNRDVFIERDGKTKELPDRGYEHFRD